MKKAMITLLALLLAFNLAACDQPAAPAQTSSSAPVEAASVTRAGPVAKEVKGVTVPAFSVSVNEAVVTHESMAAYPIYSVQATSVNSSGTETTTTYAGFAMRDVLKAAGLEENYIWMQAIADDGYTVTLTGEIVTDDTTLLAVTKDGSPFSIAPWFAPCPSGTSGDYLKGTVSILVNTVEGAPDVITPQIDTGDSSSDVADKALPEILDRTEKVRFAPYSFKVNGKDVTNDTLEGLAIYKITATTTNKKDETVQADYTGYKLADVLKAAGAGDKNVKVIAHDGFESTLTAEMVASDHTLLAIEKDKETGENGTIWLAPCTQTSAGSYAKLVVAITSE